MGQTSFPTVTAGTEPVCYHNGSYSNPAKDKYGRHKKLPIMDRPVVAWDMEGMNLSGDDKPQHPVLFGHSQDVDGAMLDRRLSSFDMLTLIIETGRKYPDAIHVGYAFKYDSNMLMQDFPYKALRLVWDKNRVKLRQFDNGQTWYWTICYLPGKMLTITRSDNAKPARRDSHNPNRTSVTIYDFSSFFGGSTFLNTAETILKKELTDEDREVIRHGKQARGSQGWDEISTVRHYWSREIVLIQRVFERFRKIMHDAGFHLGEWYGPGALANYINRVRNIRPHLRGGQTTSGVMPPEVHEASKIAFSGGRFEAFKLGRVKGPIHAVDINSAYPYALTMIPSLAENQGKWRHIWKPQKIERFGVYRIDFKATNGHMIERRPMPLFWRDARGMISYPNRVSGWYMSPEARIALGMPGMEIQEGWVWDNEESTFPWEFLHGMYDTRKRLGKKNLASMPFKLGPNSLYGKYAQTVGWDEDKGLPPKSHCLIVAAWITSYCRAMLWSALSKAPGELVAVETDSIYTTADPETLGIKLGDALGEWSHETYEEIVYLQSGMYLTKKDGEWRGVRSRGIGRSEFSIEPTIDYLQGLQPGDAWEPMQITTRPRFVGMGRALAGRNFKENYCTWQSDVKEISFGDTGKRRHSQKCCRSCAEGLTPWDSPHDTFVFSRSDGFAVSHPRRLPWEGSHTEEVQKIRDEMKLAHEMA